jgi:flagellar hook-associated protein 3 FlgL
MRMTFTTINRHMQNVIQDRYSDLARLQEQLSTGKRLMRPSDDPVDVANDLKMRSKTAQLSQYKRNISDGLSFMQVTDTAMMSMNDLMQRLRELAVQGASDTIGATERLYISREVEELSRQMISIANTRYKGDYIFAGTQTQIAPFPLDSSQAETPDDYTQMKMAYYDGTAQPIGDPLQLYDGFTGRPITNVIPGSFKLSAFGTEYVEGEDYSIDYANGTITINPSSPNAAALAVNVNPHDPLGGGGVNYSHGAFSITFDHVGKGQDVYGAPVATTGTIYREVETDITAAINVTGDELVRDNATGTDLMDVLVRFGQQLRENDRTGIQETIGKLDVSFKNILAAQTRNGARINRFEATLSRNEQQTNEATRLLAELEDADFAETVSKFSLAETVYNAALKSAAKAIQPTLTNFI